MNEIAHMKYDEGVQEKIRAGKRKPRAKRAGAP